MSKLDDVDDEQIFILRVLNVKREHLGGLVDILIESETNGAGVVFRGLDASQDIEIQTQERVPPGRYTITATSKDGTGCSTVQVGREGSYRFTIVVNQAGGGYGARSVKGTLMFDHGLPAAGVTVRLYSVGFAGQDLLLGETTAGADGGYAFSYTDPANLQLRVLDSLQKEVTISATKFRADTSETLHVVVPENVQPLGSEFFRLSSDMDRIVGGIVALAGARESVERQDLTLLNQVSNWDARIVALAATAAQQTTQLGLSADTTQVLYALYRVGLPTDSQQLSAVSLDVVQAALDKANKSGVVNLTDAQMREGLYAFSRFSEKIRLATVVPGTVSNFSDMLAANLNADQRATFSSLYFQDPAQGAELWTKAAQAGLPASAIDSLKLQGKFLYLTANSAPLAQRLQDEIGSVQNLPHLAYKDFHQMDTWSTLLTGLAGSGGNAELEKLIPAVYPGKATADRLQAYSADLARKVRISFPTEVTARMVETGTIPINDHSAPVATFLRAASERGYALGRTPLNSFLNQQAQDLPELDVAATESLKTLHRLFQITPSPESLQAAVTAGLTSASQIASYSHDEFIQQYGNYFGSYQDASFVYRKAWLVSSVTFNFFSMAKQLDTVPPIYGISASQGDRQSAKDAIVKQFPNMASLFGSLDFCECEECRSVLSPAAYFVDLLEFLRKSEANKFGNTPLDVLVGKPDAIPGRRPDLAALPLTCENTNTALPYIDLVNEILEYFIAHSRLDASAAYDTGSATTADLTAEPQHILPDVYSTTLKQTVYPRKLPFDLWIETVRGFLNYFKTPLNEVLETLRPNDALELFTDGAGRSYYRAQILAEALELSPAEYQVLTATTPANWFELYGYADEPSALLALPSAKVLAQRLDISYVEIAGLVTSRFLNPSLNALLFQFNRFQIDLRTAFNYTSQPGYPALSAADTAAFENLLQSVTDRYKKQNPASTFDAKTWLIAALPANYSTKVLILRDPDTGCDFGSTTLQYADGTPPTPLDYLKFNLFVRLWKKLGWSLDETDRSLQLFFPAALPAWTDAGFATAFGTAWKTALVYMAHLNDLNAQLAPTLGLSALLPLWSNLPTQGDNPLYAQLFLAPGVLSNDLSFDDPAAQFPWATGDPLSLHLAAVEGVLGLTSDEITAILADAGGAVTTVNAPPMPGFSLTNLSICYRYSLLATCLQLTVSDMIALKTLSGLNPFQPLSGTPLALLADDVLFNQTFAFLRAAGAVQNSGFTMEDLRYLLRQQFDPVGKYQVDSNALMALVQSVANGLGQIRNQNTVPPGLEGLPETVINQRLSGLIPAAVLKTLFAQITNSKTASASQGGVVPASAIDPAPFAAETRIGFAYDAVTQIQTVSYQGLLLDWKKNELLQINNSPLFSGLLNGVQRDAQNSFRSSVENILGVWASLAQYEAVRMAAVGLAAGPLMRTDPALSLSFDQAGQIQWLGYRGVLTDAKKSTLTTLNNSPLLAQVLTDVQQQAMPAYSEVAGNVIALWVSVQTVVAVQGGVLLANSIDPTVFAAYPEAQFIYDAASSTQRLIYQGFLSNDKQVLLAGLIPGSLVLANLLQTVRSESIQLFQTLATGLLAAVTPSVVDGFIAPYAQIDNAQKQKRVKAKLVAAFLPLQARKLSRDLIAKSISGNLGSDPFLTETLITDAAYLSDPGNPGQSLLGACLALGTAGVSAIYFASSDGTGAALTSGIALTTDTTDPTNPNAGMAGTGSAHFEGYLQVPADGPYRFLAVLGDINSSAALQIDSPDPAVLLKNPVIPPSVTAIKVHDEVSQFVQLKGGVPYHFTLDFTNLGANGASLLVQGENLPKGPLSQVVLYPQKTVEEFLRARLLLSKALQILQGVSFDEREVSDLTANAAQFNNLRLSSLPTLASDDSTARATALFSQFLALADYADLRKGPSGGTDGLVDVFQNVNQVFSEPLATQDSTNNPDTPWKRLATLTRRDAQLIRDVARYFGLIVETPAGANRNVQAVGDFGNNKGIRRIWQALQVLQIVSIPVSALTAATAIVSLAPPMGSPGPDAIAANLKNAVKAQYEVDAWRPIAQSVFDKLRRRKRDALVAYLINALGLGNSNQLFEYFLVDPGMEPVVQTSRLRLAISSVQTFIQRCLFDLESGNASHPELNIAPRVIKADWWEWMKRYRVWEANRKIFLFPENWMEPELRLDKTDLFQNLEGALLQGDVTQDLAEAAFLDYLKGLDLRARLDVVASYLDQDPTHLDVSTLYVLGRTYGVPHKYFFRTYSNGTWSGWEVVTPDIEGNHMVLVVWRGRLNLFWVTFSITSDQPSAPGPGGAPVTSLSLGDLTDGIYASQASPVVHVHLHWSEYFKGKWSNRLSSDPSMDQVLDGLDHMVELRNGFDANSSVYMRVSKEIDDAGNEGAVKIHLDVLGYDTYMSFRVTSKNCAPAFSGAYYEWPPDMPYNENGLDATVYTGKTTLEASFLTDISLLGKTYPAYTTEPILHTVNEFEILVCANNVAPPFLDPHEPQYWDAGALVSPFFYKDTRGPSGSPGTPFYDELTFFVQPSLTERTVFEWEGWALPPPQNNIWKYVTAVEKVALLTQVPAAGPVPVNPPDPEYSLFKLRPNVDWVSQAGTAISYGDALIGKGGGISAGQVAASRRILSSGTTLTGPQGLRLQSNLNSGSARTKLSEGRKS